jgi:pseudaminic acid synthase
MNFNIETLGNRTKPFIIAEMSGNHNQSIDRAKEIIRAASESGVDAIKFQTYTADTITLNHASVDFEINDEKSLWKGKKLHDLYKLAYTPWEWHKELFEYAQNLGLLAFSSPFDETAVDFLEELNVPLYKIASFENNHHPLLIKIAKTGKPVIMSTGLSSILDIQESVNILKQNGCKSITLLKCTSTYPAPPENTNLKTIPLLKEVFTECNIGLSDHTMGLGVSIASVALGASVIEKHFTLKRSDGGVDSTFSMEPAEMSMLVEESNKAWLALGDIQINIQESEVKSLIFKRSIYVAKDIRKGEVFNEENIRVVRPGNGLHPRYYLSLIGMKSSTELRKGTPFSLNFLDKNE